jgi:hypothetical protein
MQEALTLTKENPMFTSVNNSGAKNAEILLTFEFRKNIFFKLNPKYTNKIKHGCTVARPKMWVYCNLLETIMVVRKQSVFALSLWVMHVYIETLILFDENLLKITKKS